MMTRRGFLATGLASVAGLALAVVGYRKYAAYHSPPRRLDKDDLVEYLERTFAYLQPDRASVEKYVDLYLVHYDAAPTFRELPRLESAFLLSTNFFQSGQPATGPVRFAAFYHPYVSPCYNPLVQGT